MARPARSLVCRWNLHRRHGAYGYESAKAQYAPFDRLQDPDPETRAHLVRVITGACGAGKNAYVTIKTRWKGRAIVGGGVRQENYGLLRLTYGKPHRKLKATI